jgi:hypothetical protein
MSDALQTVVHGLDALVAGDLQQSLPRQNGDDEKAALDDEKAALDVEPLAVAPAAL